MFYKRLDWEEVGLEYALTPNDFSPSNAKARVERRMTKIEL